MSKPLYALIIPILFLSIMATASAQWSSDPTINTPVCTAPSHQYSPEILLLDSGGFIVVWHDFRAGNTSDIYLQKFDSSGVAQWVPGGVALTSAPDHQWSQVITTDGAGGVIVAWHDERSGTDYFDIYARRIDASGNPLWTADGVPISIAASHDEWPWITSDGVGGAYIAWGGTNLSVQRINSSGQVQWATDGVKIVSGSGMYDNRWPKIIGDGSGGAFVVWQHYSDTTGWDIYAQRLNGFGIQLWAPGGVAISTAGGFQEKPCLVSDGSDGAIIAWEDSRGTDWDIYAQKISGSGVVQWETNGKPVCTVLSDQRSPLGNHGTSSIITSDGMGGAIITWQDLRSGRWSVYAQRLDGSGTGVWQYNGVLVSEGGNQQTPAITGDDSGGAIITWESKTLDGWTDIYTQRINGSGQKVWGDGGLPVCIAPYDQLRPRVTADHKGGAIVVWHDNRNGSDYDIFTQNVPDGLKAFSMGPSISFIQDVPADQGGRVTVAWDRSIGDKAPSEFITYYSVWRGIDVEPPPAATSIMPVTGLPDNIGGKNYRFLPDADGGTYWELIGTVVAHYLEGYSFTANTLWDSTAEGPAWFKFFVSAQTTDPFVFWDSEIDSGYSVDNLSPSPVPALASIVIPGPAVFLRWPENTTDPDVKVYEIHRSTSAGFIADGTTGIGQTSDTTFTDVYPIAGIVNYYRIVTVDIHGNRSDPSVVSAADPGSTGSYPVKDKWNLVSVPLTIEDYTCTSVYPSAVSGALTYLGAYVPAPVLANGKGYWLQFDGEQTVAMTGEYRPIDTIAVVDGWNLIGSVTARVRVSEIGSIPGGIITSVFFGYDRVYRESGSIDPGKGYWVKVSGVGYLILNSLEAPSPSARIRIEKSGSPPPPPPGISVDAAPERFSLEQNYPNPFNPTTEITYSLPEADQVTLRILDILGKEIITLVNERKESGTHTANWNAEGYPSGIYFYRLTAGDFTETKKMVLMK